MRGRNIQRAIEAVKEKGVDTDLELYDKIVNALIEKKQNGSSAGYQYM